MYIFASLRRHAKTLYVNAVGLEKIIHAEIFLVFKLQLSAIAAYSAIIVMQFMIGKFINRV